MNRLIKTITVRDLIRDLPTRWYNNYAPFFNDNYYLGEFRLTKKEIYERMLKMHLGTVSVKEINDLIGNDSWTNITCTSCGTENLKTAVNIKKTIDDHGIFLCPVCIAEIVKELLTANMG